MRVIQGWARSYCCRALKLPYKTMKRFDEAIEFTDNRSSTNNYCVSGYRDKNGKLLPKKIAEPNFFDSIN